MMAPDRRRRPRSRDLVAYALLALPLTGCDGVDGSATDRAAAQMRVVSTPVPVTPSLELSNADIVRTSDGTLYLAMADRLLVVASDGTARHVETSVPVRYLARDGRDKVFGTAGSGVVEITRSGKLMLLAGVLPQERERLDVADVDGPWRAARFRGASQISADAAGNIYMVDGYLPGLYGRRIGIDGQVTTLFRQLRAAGEANNFGWRNFAADSKGNLYVGGYGVVMMVTPAGVLHPVADSRTPSSLSRIDELKIDGRDNVYANDMGEIKKIAPNGTVTKVLGDSCRVPEWTKSRDWVKARAGGCTAGLVDGRVEGQILRIDGFEVDDEGNIYFVDQAFNALRKATPAGALSTIARGPLRAH
jgi:hypothetical protein